VANRARQPGTYIELDDAWNDPGWTRVPNGIARCTTISRRVKGWILEVASHAPGRRLTVTEMLKCSTDGRDATYATIKEAVAAGFVTRRQERGEHGRMGPVIYTVHVKRQNPSSQPLTDFPDAAEPDTANPESKRHKTRTAEDKDLKQDAAAASSPTETALEDQNNAGSASAPSPRCRGDEPPHPQDPQPESAPEPQPDMWDTGNYPTSPTEALHNLTPGHLTQYGRYEKLARHLDLYDRWVPNGLEPNDYNAIEAMVDRGEYWKKILRYLLNERGYGKDEITRYITQIVTCLKAAA